MARTHPPNTALQRTRSAPLRSPLSFEPLGAPTLETLGDGLIRQVLSQVALFLLILSGFQGCAVTPAPSDVAGFPPTCQECFETKDYDWSDYSARMMQRIRAKWDIPELAKAGFKGQATVCFVITRDGKVDAIQILSPSPIRKFDIAAVDAVRHSSPLPPLPADFRRERERVTLTFFYNMRPEQRSLDRAKVSGSQE